MKLRVNIVPNDHPNSNGKWITWNCKTLNPWRGCTKPPKGFHIVSSRKPYRKIRE